jgi:enterochelin esterase-like enzyme
MIRLLYRSLIELHPAPFRDRFGDEMMWIFDEVPENGRLRLLADGVISLIRQWLFHTRLWNFAVGALMSLLMLITFVNSFKVIIGTVQSYRFDSAALADQRIICVYTPPYYDPHAKEGYRLLVLSDGTSYQNWLSAVMMLDQLIRSKTLPPIVSVWAETPPVVGGSEPNRDSEFFAEDLLPWLHDRLNITSDPQRTIIGSTGPAPAAVFAAMQRPDLFGNVLSQSQSLWEWHDEATWESLTSQYEFDPKFSVHFFIEATVPEDNTTDGAASLEANGHFPEVLKGRGYRVIQDEVGGSGEPVNWKETLPQGLVALVR